MTVVNSRKLTIRNVDFYFQYIDHRNQQSPTFLWMLSSVENLQLDNNNNATTYHIQLIAMREFGLLFLAYLLFVAVRWI